MPDAADVRCHLFPLRFVCPSCDRDMAVQQRILHGIGSDPRDVWECGQCHFQCQGIECNYCDRLFGCFGLNCSDGCGCFWPEPIAADAVPAALAGPVWLTITNALSGQPLFKQIITDVNMIKVSAWDFICNIMYGNERFHTHIVTPVFPDGVNAFFSVRQLLTVTNTFPVCLLARQPGTYGGPCLVCGQGAAYDRICGDSANGYQCSYCARSAESEWQGRSEEQGRPANFRQGRPWSV